MNSVPVSFDRRDMKCLTSFFAIVKNWTPFERFSFLTEFNKITRVVGYPTTKLDLTISCLNGEFEILALENTNDFNFKAWVRPPDDLESF